MPFQPISARQHDADEPSTPNLIYTESTSIASPKPAVPITYLDLSAGYPWEGVLKHMFAAHGPKAKPIHVDVNGRKGRRAVCVLYGDSMRYEVLDLDAAIEEQEEIEVSYADAVEELMDSE